MVRFHVLTENTVRKRGLSGELGLSLWIEAGDKKILFDTGQSQIYRSNADYMGVQLEEADFIILSHGHFDHTGGLMHFPKKDTDAKLYLHPDALLKKYRKPDNGEALKDIGAPWNLQDIGFSDERIILNKEPLFLDDRILISGEIPRTTSFEEVPEYFVTLRDGNIVHDIMVDEQMLIIKEQDGIVVFLGCSHPGVINCLKYALELFSGSKILSLIAGMHLEAVDRVRLQTTIDYFLDYNIERVIPLHCTGFTAASQMKSILGDRCTICSTGDTVEI